MPPQRRTQLPDEKKFFFCCIYGLKYKYHACDKLKGMRIAKKSFKL